MTKQEIKVLQLSNKYNAAQAQRYGDLSDKLIEELKVKDNTISYLRRTLAKAYKDINDIEATIVTTNIANTIDKINQLKLNLRIYKEVNR